MLCRYTLSATILLKLPFTLLNLTRYLKNADFLKALSIGLNDMISPKKLSLTRYSCLHTKDFFEEQPESFAPATLPSFPIHYLVFNNLPVNPLYLFSNTDLFSYKSTGCKSHFRVYKPSENYNIKRITAA